MSSSTPSVKTMGDYSTQSFSHSFIRFSHEFGYPKFMLIDLGHHFVKGCQTMQLCFKKIKGKPHKDMMVKFDICPVAGQNFSGKVECKICQMKELLEKCIKSKTIVWQWKAVAVDSNCSLGKPCEWFLKYGLDYSKQIKTHEINEEIMIGILYYQWKSLEITKR